MADLFGEDDILQQWLQDARRYELVDDLELYAATGLASAKEQMQFARADENALIDEIDKTKDRMELLDKSRVGMQASQEAEIRKLQTSVEFLRHLVDETRGEAQAAKALAAKVEKRRVIEEQAVLRRFDMAKRAAKAARKLTKATEVFSASSRELFAERDELLNRLSQAKLTWQTASESLHLSAAHVNKMESEIARCSLPTDSSGTPVDTALAAEVKVLLAEQRSLEEELDKVPLFPAVGERPIADIVEEITKVEGEQDDLEVDSQRQILELKLALERGVLRREQLEQKIQELRATPAAEPVAAEPLASETVSSEPDEAFIDEELLTRLEFEAEALTNEIWISRSLVHEYQKRLAQVITEAPALYRCHQD